LDSLEFHGVFIKISAFPSVLLRELRGFIINASFNLGLLLGLLAVGLSIITGLLYSISKKIFIGNREWRFLIFFGKK
jgi:hypothetical protein